MAYTIRFTLSKYLTKDTRNGSTGSSKQIATNTKLCIQDFISIYTHPIEKGL